MLADTRGWICVWEWGHTVVGDVGGAQGAYDRKWDAEAFGRVVHFLPLACCERSGRQHERGHADEGQRGIATCIESVGA